MILGIDYASVDGNIPPDVTKLTGVGVSFAVVRGAWGTWADPNLRRDLPALKGGGLTVGAYLFLRFPELGHSAPSPDDQALALVDACAGMEPELDLPPTVDVEFPGKGITDTGLTPAEALGWIRVAVQTLKKRYPTVMIYTSARVWRDDMQNIAAGDLGDCPLWVKTPYVVGTRQLPRWPDQFTYPTQIPPPWHSQAWIQQYQGDALGVPGVSATCDLNQFLAGHDDPTDPRTGWIHPRLAGRTLTDFQSASGLVADGVIGPRTFAALCRVRP